MKLGANMVVSLGLEHALLVEEVDLGTVELLGLVALDLHRVGEDAAREEGLRLEVDVLHLLEALQSALLPHCVQVRHEVAADGLAAAQVFEGALELPLVRELLDELPVRDCDGDHEALGGVAVDEDLGQLVALEVGVLHLLGGHVLALLQLEDVLLPVHDADRPRLRAHRAHVAGLQPPVGRDRLLRLLLVVVVPHKDRRSPGPNLPARSGVPVGVLVGGQVAHLRNVD
jgi:hypothetical protein